jgi:hypothetical protein
MPVRRSRRSKRLQGNEQLCQRSVKVCNRRFELVPLLAGRQALDFFGGFDRAGGAKVGRQAFERMRGMSNAVCVALSQTDSHFMQPAAAVVAQQTHHLSKKISVLAHSSERCLVIENLRYVRCGHRTGSDV